MLVGHPERRHAPQLYRASSPEVHCRIAAVFGSSDIDTRGIKRVAIDKTASGINASRLADMMCHHQQAGDCTQCPEVVPSTDRNDRCIIPDSRLRTFLMETKLTRDALGELHKLSSGNTAVHEMVEMLSSYDDDTLRYIEGEIEPNLFG